MRGRSIEILGIAACSLHLDSRLSFHRNGLDWRESQRLPPGCSWLDDSIQRLNVSQIVVESVLTTIFRAVDSPTCWLRALIEQKKPKTTSHSSAHTQCVVFTSEELEPQDVLTRTALEFSQEPFQGLFVAFCRIRFYKTSERVIKVGSDELDCFMVAAKAVPQSPDWWVFTLKRSNQEMQTCGLLLVGKQWATSSGFSSRNAEYGCCFSAMLQCRGAAALFRLRGSPPTSLGTDCSLDFPEEYLSQAHKNKEIHPSHSLEFWTFVHIPHITRVFLIFF